MPRRTQVGHVLAKGLGIKLESPEEDVSRGESVFSVETADTFIEQGPTTTEWLAGGVPSKDDVVDYVKSLFPFISWIGFYNVQWLIGDLVAGITVGAIVIPQGMAYAKLAQLPVEFGLYSSFMGVICYWFFATSKDITIGPVAVMSTLVGNIISNAVAEHPEYEQAPWVIACALSVITGCIVLFIGLIRCGWIVELIPLVSLAAFMTGSSISIVSGQVSTLLGLSGFSTRGPTYLVIINSLKHLGTATVDAAMGLTALTLLYGLRTACSWAASRYPSRQKLFFFLSTLRTVFVILLYTFISFLVNRTRRDNHAFSILGSVPGGKFMLDFLAGIMIAPYGQVGFQHAEVPTLNAEIISLFINELPAAVIVLLIEHIAISKSFGRVNNYVINPSQEMVAIGATNILGPFLGGYPATGSFSRTAVKSKAGVRTPFAGVITGLVVLLAIYALPAVFYFIPNASLAAVIIHAVGDLITPPQTLYKFWRVNPIEVVIFFIGVIVIIFTTIEDGIYVTVCLSFAVYIYRILRSHGRFLGRVKVQSVLGDHVVGDDSQPVGQYGTFEQLDHSASPPTRNIFLPVDHADGSNPEIDIASPYPGIFIYRFSETFNYPSASSTLDYLSSYIFANTRRTQTDSFARPGDRPWNDPGPKKGQAEDMGKPMLKAVILDFSSVNTVDVTSVQQLIDIRNQMDRYTAPDVVDWHIACINNRWTKRALVSAGFGYPAERPDGLHQRWKSIFSVAEIGGASSAAAVAEQEQNEKELQQHQHQHQHGGGSSNKAVDPLDAIERSEASSVADADADLAKDPVAAGAPQGPRLRSVGEPRKRVVVHGLNRPLFHIDLTSALQSAIANVRAREEHSTAAAAATSTNR
ncbi:hypothetical protein DL762_007160 [Monosporascus cannonballus]|uniref:STAS domain-containing protein n=1 Tax=Monosporascus cannonballus TaxID=155416 RepID=A0ABY0GZZ7_9PEZI|nr:hypothetical protein DL762_007160 [Monosporascus cannonballus]